jgi:hypothetical protein
VPAVAVQRLLYRGGYGALFERGHAVVDLVPGETVLDDNVNGFRQVNRGLFLKASYLRRF